MRPSHGTMNSRQKIDGSAHFVRGGQRDDHRPNRKRLRAILLLSGQRLGNSVRIYLENTPSPQRHLLMNTRMAVTSYQLSPELKKFWHSENFCHVGRILSRMKCCHGRK